MLNCGFGLRKRHGGAFTRNSQLGSCQRFGAFAKFFLRTPVMLHHLKIPPGADGIRYARPQKSAGHRPAQWTLQIERAIQIKNQGANGLFPLERGIGGGL